MLIGYSNLLFFSILTTLHARQIFTHALPPRQPLLAQRTQRTPNKTTHRPQDPPRTVVTPEPFRIRSMAMEERFVAAKVHLPQAAAMFRRVCDMAVGQWP